LRLKPYYYYSVSHGTYDPSNLYKGFLTEALSFSPLCGLLIGHEVLRVAERILVLPRWQETAAHRCVLLNPLKPNYLKKKASYRTANLHMLHFIYLFNKYTY